ncbi:MAG: tetratricopeptide repeat protein [Candidatus Omnitrophica bacterium]|nr:tetratricopeptide repeat protein [Candidatus Omnitrophota bacterium]MDD5592973.1 tetratricopeptide repeat protein [Candidatus Omnitrophota bacterium]
MYEQQGDIGMAIREYKKALKTDNENAVIHLNLAATYIKDNRIPDAIKELELTTRLDPEAAEPHAILALLYSSQNKPEPAAAEYEIALKNASKREPDNIDIYKGLGLVYLQQKKIQDAEYIYKLILNLSPDDPEAHFYLASIYDESRKRGLAIAELKKSLKSKPDYPEALNYLGYLYVQENQNLDSAEIMIKKALEMQPDNGAYVDSLGWLYFKQGKIQEAIGQLNKAASLMDDPIIYDHLGDVYFKVNDAANAKLNWEKSLKLDPKQERVKVKIEKARDGSQASTELSPKESKRDTSNRN